MNRRSSSLLTSSLLLLLMAVPLLPGCSRGRSKREVVYVSAPQLALRDRLAPVYNKLAVLKNGDRVEVLDRDRRFLKVRTASGAEGWIEQRYVITQQGFDQFQKLAQEHKSDPVQSTGVTRNDTNIHITPARDADHLYQLTAGEKVSIVQRATGEKQLPGSVVPANSQGGKDAPQPAMEDWWMVRDSEGRTGWVLARMVDVDVPLDIAQYAEGQRIVGFFLLDQVQNGDKKVPEYLTLLTEAKDGMPHDFSQVRVFTWNVKRHRYGTAYRERKLDGVFPVTLGTESFGAEGTLPVFVVRVRDSSGKVVERKYKLNTPIVRRVPMPGESG